MRIAACQMISGTDPEENLRHAVTLINSACASGAELVVLPEYFPLVPDHDEALVRLAEPWGNGRIQNLMKSIAREKKIWLCAGTIPIQSDDDQHYIDTAIVYSPDGEVACRYDKIHLFEFKRHDEHFAEAATTEPGQSPQHTDIECWDGAWKLGLAVSFDLRYPELFRAMATPDIIVLPAAFTETTGQCHWETLVRARAIENQCYVIACNQGGEHECGRHSWGHSLVIDPWGMTVSEMSFGEGVILADISRSRIHDIRTILPALKGRCDHL